MDYNLGRFRLNPRGTFNAQTRYDYLDLVYYEGSSYICINEEGCYGVIPDSTITSSIYWQCNAAKGSNGINANTAIPIEISENEESLTFLDIGNTF